MTLENAAGSLTTYQYDDENRLTNIQFTGAAPSTYTYDGDGKRRSAFPSGGTLSSMVWDGDDYLGEA